MASEWDGVRDEGRQSEAMHSRHMEMRWCTAHYNIRKKKSRMNLFIVLSPPLAAYIVDIVVVAVASLILVSIRECERLIVVRNAYAYVPTPEEQQSAIKPITNEMEEREKQ